MATFTYTNDVHSFESIYQALVIEGVYDAIVHMGEDLQITTDTGTQTQCDDAYANAQSGTLHSNKCARIEEVQLKSFELAQAGVTFTRASDSATGKGPLDLTKETRTDLRLLKQDIEDGTVPTPWIIYTMEGRGVELFSVADIDAAYEAVVERGVYILNDGTNSDTSKGEGQLIKDINAAISQAELDAITDTRV